MRRIRGSCGCKTTGSNVIAVSEDVEEQMVYSSLPLAISTSTIRRTRNDTTSETIRSNLYDTNYYCYKNRWSSGLSRVIRSLLLILLVVLRESSRYEGMGRVHVMVHTYETCNSTRRLVKYPFFFFRSILFF